MELCRVPNVEKVRQVVFAIDPLSAPGPDGLCSRFYQVCWEIIHCDLMAAVTDFFSGWAMPRGFQSTLLHQLGQTSYLLAYIMSTAKSLRSY